jgi:SAM-dependent methyltransferase
MAARLPARSHALLLSLGQLAADIRASGVARLERLREANPRPDQQRLDGRHRDPKRARHIRVRHPRHLSHEQRRTLLLGQTPDVDHQASERLASLGLGDRITVGYLIVSLQKLEARQWPPQLVDAAVMGHAVEPRPQRDVAVAGAQTRVGADENVLERVLDIGCAAGQHLAHVRQQARAVAVVDDAEGLLVALPEQRHELLVGAET